MYKQIVAFLNYSVLSTTTVGRSAVSEFPTITFCNFNYFNTPTGKNFLHDNLLQYEKKFSVAENNSKIKDIESRLYYVKASLLKNSTIYNNIEKRKSFGLTLNDMFLNCYFGPEPCNVNDFEYFFDVNYGNCYKFNSGFNVSNQSVPIKKVITSGDNSGYRMVLYLGPQGTDTKSSYSNGLYLSIHNRSFRGFLSTNGFNIPTGRATNIGSFNLNE